jgi:DNA-binding protein YbaB
VADPGKSTDQQLAELYGQADKTMAQLRAKVANVQQAQQDALRSTGESTSQDGSVRAVVDATGVLTSLVIAPTAFEKTTPARLAQTVVATAQAAAAQARGRMSTALASVRADDDGVQSAAAQGMAELGVPKLGVPDVPRTAVDPTAQDQWAAAAAQPPAGQQPPESAPPVVEPMRAPGASNRKRETTEAQVDDAVVEDWSDERPW